MNKKLALFIVFFCGIAVTTLEVASARIVSPFFGSTIYVWGGAIGTVLASLAIGYWLGGRVIDAYPKQGSIGFVLGVATITTLAVPWVYSAAGQWFTTWSTKDNIPVGIAVIGMMLVLFIIPIVAMGMISPMVLRLSLLDVKQAGSWSGLLSGAATVGSIVGTFIAAYLAIPYVGTRATILLASAVLGVTTVMAVTVPKLITAVVVLAFCATTAVSFGTPFLKRANVLYEHESAYQLIQVIAFKGVRYLVHDTGGGYQSSYQPGTAYTRSPYDYFGLLPYLSTNTSKHRSVLLIGLGGGNMMRMYHDLLGKQFDFSLTAVEIDQSVIDTGKQYFDIARIPMTIVHDDARHYLRTTNNTYDIIIVDAYTHELQIPIMLATQEFFGSVRSHLAPGGVLGINALALPTSRYFPKFLNTVASSFPATYVGVSATDPYNHMIIAGTAIDLRRLPTSIDPIIDPYLTAATQLHTVQVHGAVFTDDRTDLDILVQPFLN